MYVFMYVCMLWYIVTWIEQSEQKKNDYTYKIVITL